MNKFKIILIPLFLLIVSCTSNNEDENKKFNSFLNTEWENTLKENPIFATYTGDKESYISSSRK